ncbi:hypothetical protein NQ317_009752 [Molorchus minor]|uniref:Peptidase aspartic putative domain-containing protein n=1 Tax=Molorchus minor TaxID=1323400 RepID=A0ABQ9K1K6_9CUCU|nr:hypothetical protein NQ317_009752 [Molorchus minor]
MPVTTNSSAALPSDLDLPGPSRISDTTNVLASVISKPTSVLLSTAKVQILDRYGNYQTVRVLFDNCSQVNIITEKCANRLGLTRRNLSLSIHGLDHMSSAATKAVTCTIRPQSQPNPTFVFEAAVLSKICNDMPCTNISSSSWRHIYPLNLADPEFNVPGAVDLLLGAEIFPQILCGTSGRLVGEPDQPIALNTVFGWILSGKYKSQNPQINCFINTLDTSLESVLKSFWQLEEVPKKITMSADDSLCEKIFSESHSRNTTGRYVVALPFKGTEPIFSDTRSIALRRLYSLEQRLRRNPSLYEEYSNFMNEYIHSGHMEVVENCIPDSNTNTYYIPHHCVLKPESTTTKLRVVYDASSKSQENISLNDTLLVGPKLQQDIAAILLNFRIHAYVFTADIRQMYRQILISPGHQDYQRILWRVSPGEPIQDFRLCTVTYGITSSPFLAIRTLIQLANDEGARFPRAAEVLKK